MPTRASRRCAGTSSGPRGRHRRDRGARPRSLGGEAARQPSRTPERGLCFGRLDLDGVVRPLYVGRRWVREDQTPIVVNWQAPAARPFYTATVRRATERRPPSAVPHRRSPSARPLRRAARRLRRRPSSTGSRTSCSRSWNAVATSTCATSSATIQADQYRLITREPAPRRWPSEPDPGRSLAAADGGAARAASADKLRRARRNGGRHPRRGRATRPPDRSRPRVVRTPTSRCSTRRMHCSRGRTVPTATLIVDEAQDLTPMQLRMLARRSSGRSRSSATSPSRPGRFRTPGGNELRPVSGTRRVPDGRGAAARLSRSGRGHGARPTFAPADRARTSPRRSPTAPATSRPGSSGSRATRWSPRPSARQAERHCADGRTGLIAPQAILEEIEPLLPHPASAFDELGPRSRR